VGIGRLGEEVVYIYGFDDDRSVVHTAEVHTVVVFVFGGEASLQLYNLQIEG
jgi:hypothetical protein